MLYLFYAGVNDHPGTSKTLTAHVLCLIVSGTVNRKQSEIWSQTPILPPHNKDIILTISFRTQTLPFGRGELPFEIGTFDFYTLQL